MDLNTDTIISTISYVKLFALSLFIYMLAGGSLSISLAAKINSIPLVVVSFFIFIVAPLIFNKPLRLMFLKVARFTFNNNLVLLEISNYKTALIEKQLDFNCTDIKSCILSSTSQKTSTIKLYFQDSIKLQYTFVNEGEIIEDNGNFENNVSLAVFRKIYSFNNKISLLPPFYASKKGIFALIVLTGLFITAIIMDVIYSGSIPITLFMGAALYFQIVMRRKRDIEIFKNIKNSLR